MLTHGDNATSGASVSLPGLCMERVDSRRECARTSLSRLIRADICVDFFIVSSTFDVLMTWVRHQIKSQVFGLLAELSELPLVLLVQILLCTACLVGCLLCEHMVDNFRQFMGRGCGGLDGSSTLLDRLWTEKLSARTYCAPVFRCRPICRAIAWHVQPCCASWQTCA
jgi:hypothetical protein